MVRRCPVEVSRGLYLSATAGGKLGLVSEGKAVDGPVLARLHAVVKKRTKTGAFSEGALVASCCFSLIEALYGMFDLKPLQALADEAFRKEGGGDGRPKEEEEEEEKKSLTLKDVTLGVVGAWKAIRASRGMLDQDWRELRCRRAAFSCLCAAVRSTQDQEKFFDILLWSDPVLEKPSAQVAAAAGGAKTSVLALVLDMRKEHAFEVSPPAFPTTLLRPPRPPPLGRGRNPDGKTAAAVARGKGRRNRGVTSSAMLSQSSLGFGGDSLAAAGGGGGGGWDSSGNGGGSGPDPAAEDARETYSSQAALAEPGGVPDGGDSGCGEESQHPGSQSQAQGNMAPLFGRTAGSAIDYFGPQGQIGGEEERGEEEKGEEVVLEMSHVNKEPCMRALLLVVQTEERLFGDSWDEKYAQSNGV